MSKKAPSNTDEQSPYLETIISRVITFDDGSRIRVFVDAPPAEDEETQDEASAAFYLHLLGRLNLIEVLTRQPAKRGKLDTQPLDLSELG